MFPAIHTSTKEAGSDVMPLSVTAEGDSAALIAKVHALSESGRYGQALALVAGELSRHPDDGELLFARASVLFDWGRMREAYTGFLQARDRGLDRTALYLNLAWSCQLLGMAEGRNLMPARRSTSILTMRPRISAWERVSGGDCQL